VQLASPTPEPESRVCERILKATEEIIERRRVRSGRATLTRWMSEKGGGGRGEKRVVVREIN
jgi:hypothetical protein